jgi:Uncharacterized conserved domain (SAYSvFN)
MPDLNTLPKQALRLVRAILPYAAAAAAYAKLLSSAAAIDDAAVQLLLSATAAAAIAWSYYWWPSSGGRVTGEAQMSGYSVFNEGIQSMLGSLRAEQFDQEVRHRPTCVMYPISFCYICLIPCLEYLQLAFDVAREANVVFLSTLHSDFDQRDDPIGDLSAQQAGRARFGPGAGRALGGSGTTAPTSTNESGPSREDEEIERRLQRLVFEKARRARMVAAAAAAAERRRQKTD